MEIGSVTIRGTATQTAKTAFQVAAGLTTERPTGVAAMMRFNTNLNRFEGHNGTGWNPIDGAGSVTSVSLLHALQRPSGDLWRPDHRFWHPDDHPRR